MTPKQANAYLGRPRGLRRKLFKEHEQLELLRSKLLPGAVRYDKERVQTSPVDSMLETYSEIDELERKFKVDIDTLLQIKEEVKETISMIPNSRYQEVLMKYFYWGFSIADIADDYGITTRHCFRLKNQAIDLLCEIVNKEQGHV